MLEHNTEIVLLLNPSHELCCQLCSLRLWRQARQRSDTSKKMWKSRIYTNAGLHSFRNCWFLSWTSYCSMSGSLGTWRLSDPPEWSSRASFLGTWRCGFPACSWLMTEEGLDRFPIPQKSRHIRRLASFKGKPYFFQGKLSLEGEDFSLHPVPAAHLGL